MFDYEILWGYLDQGAQTGVGLILMQQKSMSLTVNLLLCRPFYVYCDQMAEVRFMQF